MVSVFQYYVNSHVNEQNQLYIHILIVPFHFVFCLCCVFLRDFWFWLFLICIYAMQPSFYSLCVVLFCQGNKIGWHIIYWSRSRAFFIHSNTPRSNKNVKISLIFNMVYRFAITHMQTNRFFPPAAFVFFLFIFGFLLLILEQVQAQMLWCQFVFHQRFFSSHLFNVVFFFFFFALVYISPMNPKTEQTVCPAMESEYEAQLADYSLQDSPFYEASAPIIFDLSATSAHAYSTNRSAPTMTDALNLTSKRTSSLMMSSLCQIIRSGSAADTNIDERDNVADLSNNKSIKATGDGNDIKAFGINSSLYTSDSDMNRALNNGNINGAPAKKKRKCVTFLPNYVQVIFVLQPTYLTHTILNKPHSHIDEVKSDMSDLFFLLLLLLVLVLLLVMSCCHHYTDLLSINWIIVVIVAVVVL